MQDTKENSVVEIEERTDEKQEVEEEPESIESTEMDYGAIYGKILDEAIWQYSEYNGCFDEKSNDNETDTCSNCHKMLYGT